jgi:hypothetical protein
MKNSILVSAIALVGILASCSKDDIQVPATYSKPTTEAVYALKPVVALSLVGRSSDTSKNSGVVINEGFTVSAQVIKIGNAEHKNEWPK